MKQDISEPLLVCYVIDALGLGGSERKCLDLSARMVKEGQRSHLITLGPLPSEAVLAQIGEGVSINALGATGRPGPATFARLYHELRRLKPAVVHTFLANSNRFGPFIAKSAGASASVCNLGAVYQRHANRHAWLERAGFRTATRGVACSEAVRRFFHEERHYPAEKLVVIPNPVRVHQIAFRDAAVRRDMRAQLGLGDEHCAVFTACGLRHIKGLHVLVPAAARLLRSAPHVRWLIAGEGPYRGEVEQLIRAHGVGDQVRLLGNRLDIPHLLQAMDIYTQPSLSEGFGIAVAEAMAAGLPVVASRVDGLPEVVDHGRTGWLVPPEDEAALVTAWQEVLADPTRAEAVGQAARSAVEERFALERIGERYLALYRSLASAGDSVS